MRIYLTVDIGCLECGENTSLLGAYKTEQEAVDKSNSAREEYESTNNYMIPNHVFWVFGCEVPE